MGGDHAVVAVGAEDRVAEVGEDVYLGAEPDGFAWVGEGVAVGEGEVPPAGGGLGAVGVGGEDVPVAEDDSGGRFGARSCVCCYAVVCAFQLDGLEVRVVLWVIRERLERLIKTRLKSFQRGFIPRFDRWPDPRHTISTIPPLFTKNSLERLGQIKLVYLAPHPRPPTRLPPLIRWVQLPRPPFTSRLLRLLVPLLLHHRHTEVHHPVEHPVLAVEVEFPVLVGEVLALFTEEETSECAGGVSSGCVCVCGAGGGDTMCEGCEALVCRACKEEEEGARAECEEEVPWTEAGGG